MQARAACARRAASRQCHRARPACPAAMAPTPTPGAPRTATTASSAPLRSARCAPDLHSLLGAVCAACMLAAERPACMRTGVAAVLHVPLQLDQPGGRQQQLPRGDHPRRAPGHALRCDRLLWRLPQRHLPGRHRPQGAAFAASLCPSPGASTVPLHTHCSCACTARWA